VTLAYRVVAAIAYRHRPLVRVMAEEVPAAELRYVVPFEARSRYVGADYVEQLAKVRGGTRPPRAAMLRPDFLGQEGEKSSSPRSCLATRSAKSSEASFDDATFLLIPPRARVDPRV
jgi:hypothetical protein